MASTKLNYLIGIGAIVLYVDTFFFVIPSTDCDVVNVFCNLTPWLTSIGYSLCYGTILAKMARVYYIFNNPTANKKVCMLQVQVVVYIMKGGGGTPMTPCYSIYLTPPERSSSVHLEYDTELYKNFF